MDEAERCHRLAYIAYGDVLAAGTAEEVIAGQRLHTWELSGEGIQGLASPLRRLPGADLVASFGSTLHVSGTDRATLQASLVAFATGKRLKLTAVAPSLEDAFIHLMQGSRDQFGGAA
jgi:ABC-2 type transport system ATP-binding protein